MSTVEERRAARAAKRAAHKEAWKTHPANANAAWMQKQAELKAAAEIPADMPQEAESDGALSKLRAALADVSRPLHERIFAAESVIPFEIAAAGLVGVPAEQVSSTAYKFLQSVATSVDVPAPLRLKSLKILASVEASKARSVDAGQLAEERETFRLRVNAQRRVVLTEAGCWRRVCLDGREWELKADDEFEVITAPNQTPGDSISTILDRVLMLSRAQRKQRARARCEQLLSIRAGNRSDAWEALIHDAAAD